MAHRAKKYVVAVDEYGVSRSGRFNLRDKVAILTSLRDERLNRAQAKERYGVTDDELSEWQVNFAEHGHAGLLVTRAQRVQRRPRRYQQRRASVAARSHHKKKVAKLKPEPMPEPKRVSSLEDIPAPPRSGRYVAKLKEAMVQAIEEGVRNSAFTLEDALAHCKIERPEYDSWKSDLESHGRKGLQITKLQRTHGRAVRNPAVPRTGSTRY